jgi:4,5-dihydroxyphthalate decarboxylase
MSAIDAASGSKSRKKLELSIAFALNPRTQAVLDGTAAPEGIDLVPSVVFPSELFWRQMKFGEFDISEMSLSSLMMMISRKDERWIGLPIFTTRHFFHTWVLVREDSGIKMPTDLKGRRVGVPEYQQTAALWTRGILEHEFGVHPKDMQFWMERDLSHSHAGALGFRPPADVTINQIPADKNIGTMMLSGELDATLLYIREQNLVDRSTADLWNHPGIKPLFADPVSEGIRYYKATGIFPINHAMVIRREIVEKHPWAVLNVFKAFNDANTIADRMRASHMEYHLATGEVPPNARSAIQRPIVQHGIAANRTVLETAAQYSYEQGLTPSGLSLDRLFAASTLDS